MRYIEPAATVETKAANDLKIYSIVEPGKPHHYVNRYYLGRRSARSGSFVLDCYHHFLQSNYWLSTYENIQFGRSVLTKIIINQKPSSLRWRNDIFDGSIYLLSKNHQSEKLGDFAEHCIKTHFGDQNFFTNYLNWSKEEYVEKTSKLKGHYTNCVEVKEIIRDYIIELDEDPAEYYFDVPRLRVIPNYEYMHVGVSYTYKPHRDTWYGSPACQINFWMPIFSIESYEAMPIYPSYFAATLDNSSHSFDLQQWIEVERGLAVQQFDTENRRHPVAKETVETENCLLLVGNRGDMIVFSANHLHGSQNNIGKKIRFSTDFRLFHQSDLSSNRGAKLLDDGSTSKEFGYKELFRASDFSKYR